MWTICVIRYGLLEAEYGLPDDYDGAPNYNVAPSQVMPVVTQDGPRMMRWGLIPRWAKDAKIGYTLINARAETIFDKPLWKSLIIKQRCLVPANGFYEWQKRADGKHPFFYSSGRPMCVHVRGSMGDVAS